MATFMDVSLFQQFSGIFIFLLVFVVVYGFLSMMDMFKKNPGSKGLYAIISLAVAFLVITSESVFNVITTMIPWFTVLIIFIFLIFFVLKMWVGDDGDDLFMNLIKEPTLYWILIIIFVLIFIVSLSSTFGQHLLNQNPEIKTLSSGQQVVQLSNGTVLSLDDASNQGYNVQRLQATVITTTSTTDQSLSTVSQSTATTDFSQNVLLTIIHPKVLGMILFMLIGFLTIIFLAKAGNPD